MWSRTPSGAGDPLGPFSVFDGFVVGIAWGCRRAISAAGRRSYARAGYPAGFPSILLFMIIISAFGLLH
jgi:hypothetical protein